MHNAKQVPMQLQFFTKTESGHRINDVVPRALLVGTERTRPWLLRGQNWVRPHQTPQRGQPGPTTNHFNNFLTNPQSPELPTVLKPQKMSTWCLEMGLFRLREGPLQTVRPPALPATGAELCTAEQLCPTARPKDTAAALEKHPVIFATYLRHND